MRKQAWTGGRGTEPEPWTSRGGDGLSGVLSGGRRRGLRRPRQAVKQVAPAEGACLGQARDSGVSGRGVPGSGRGRGTRPSESPQGPSWHEQPLTLWFTLQHWGALGVRQMCPGGA